MKGLKVSWKTLIVTVPCLMILLTPALRAQLYTGTVTGQVTDPSGAVVPGAQCELVDAGKGYTFKAVTDPTGRYLFNSVPPGNYGLTIESKGFRTQSQSNIILDVNQNVTVNVALQVGATTQTVEVTGQAPLLQAQDAATGQLINRQFLNDIPLVTRSVSDLAFLTPGITEVDTSCATDYVPQGNSGGECTINNFISDGSRGSTADFLLDGVTSSTYEAHGNIVMPMYAPSIDAVDEFTIQASNFSAEYGFTGSTIINMVIRSGTNKFHGSGYDFLRNKVLDANNFFANEAGASLPPLKQNNFGGTVGGPIRRDKTFFFFDYDGLRENILDSFSAGVATAAEKTGDFGELCGYAGGTFDSNGMCNAPNGAGQLWDPYTGVYDASQGGPVRSGYIPYNNMLTYTSPGNPKLNGTGYNLAPTPGNLIDPIALKLMQYFPTPNYNVGTGAYNPYTNWRRSVGAGDHNNQYDVKIDQRWTEKDLTSIKYSKGNNGTPPVNCYGNLADGCSFGAYNASAHLFALNHTHTFSPTLLMNLTFGVSRGAIDYTSISGQAPYQGINPVATLGMPEYMYRSGYNQLPGVAMQGYSAASSGVPTLTNISLGTQPWCCSRAGEEAYDLVGALTWVKGKHAIKFGGEGRMHRMNYVLPAFPDGYFSYDFTSTSQLPFSGGGDAMASFLTGVGGPGAGGDYEMPLHTSTQTFQYAAYAQDNFKFSHKLTLNLGVRYEVNTPQSERYNRMDYFDPSITSPLDVPSLGTLHGGEVFVTPSHRNQYDIDYSNIGPRLGFAYAMNDKTVVRGGYGIYYTVGNMGASGTTGFGFQGFDEVTPWVTSYQNDHATPWGRFSDPWPNTGPNYPVGSSLGALNDVGFGAVGPFSALDDKTPYEQTWTTGVQRQLKGNILLDVTYVGKKGTRLLNPAFQNQDFLGSQIESYDPTQLANVLSYVPNPFSGIITNTNSGLSNTTIPAWQLQLPFPQFTSVSRAYPPIANSIYNALQAKLEKRFSHGLQFLVTYTWSKSLDTASSTQGWLGGLSTMQDPNNLKLERGLSSFDIPHVFQFSYTYELPVGRGKAFGNKMNTVANAIIGGWQTNGTWRFNTGRPIALGLANGQNFPTYGGQRPDLTGTLTCNTGSWATRLNDYFANPEVVITPPAFTEGTASKTDGSCRQPGQANANLSIFKEFSLAKLREGAKMEFRFETYNALNHPQFGGPNTSLNSGSFGLVTSQVNFPREAQGALKIYW